MIAVLDASAAVEILLQRKHADLLGARVTDAEWVLVPSVYTSELCNVFWKYHMHSGQTMTREICEHLIAKGMALPDTVADDRELYREAFAMACACTSTVYDMMYLVLARRNSAHLLTMDRKLRKIASTHDVQVVQD